VHYTFYTSSSSFNYLFSCTYTRYISIGAVTIFMECREQRDEINKLRIRFCDKLTHFLTTQFQVRRQGQVRANLLVFLLLRRRDFYSMALRSRFESEMWIIKVSTWARCTARISPCRWRQRSCSWHVTLRLFSGSKIRPRRPRSHWLRCSRTINNRCAICIAPRFDDSLRIPNSLSHRSNSVVRVPTYDIDRLSIVEKGVVIHELDLILIWNDVLFMIIYCSIGGARPSHSSSAVEYS